MARKVDADLQKLMEESTAKFAGLEQALQEIKEIRDTAASDKREMKDSLQELGEKMDRQHGELVAILMNRIKLKQLKVSQSEVSIPQTTSTAMAPLRVSTSRVTDGGTEGDPWGVLAGEFSGNRPYTRRNTGSEFFQINEERVTAIGEESWPMGGRNGDQVMNRAETRFAKDSKEVEREGASDVWAGDRWIGFVEDIESTKSDGHGISLEPGKETKVIIGPMVAKDCCEDPSYRGEVRGCHLINQKKDQSVVQTANRMSRGWSRETKTETKDLNQKYVVMDPVLENQKEKLLDREVGCKSVGIEEEKMAEDRDLEDNSGGGNGHGSYNSLDVRCLASDDKKGIVHGCHSMKENSNMNGKGQIIDKSGIFWPSDHVIIDNLLHRFYFYTKLEGKLKFSLNEKFDMECIRFGSREVHYEDDYQWDPGIKTGLKQHLEDKVFLGPGVLIRIIIIITIILIMDTPIGHLMVKLVRHHLQVARLEEQKDSRVTEEIKWLARGPHRFVKRYSGYLVKGYRFHTKECEKSLKTQNSGVVVTVVDGSCPSGSTTHGVINYYGALTDIVELNYSGKIRVVLFKCDWVDTDRGCKRDEFGITLVNFSYLVHTGVNLLDDPFVLASQVDKVYYAHDPKLKDWFVARQVKVRDAFNMQCDTDQSSLNSLLYTFDVPYLDRVGSDVDDEADGTPIIESEEVEEDENEI